MVEIEEELKTLPIKIEDSDKERRLEELRIHFENIYCTLMDGEVIPNKKYKM